MYVIDTKQNLEDGSFNPPFAMICHPKTGSQSMERVLRSTFDARVVNGMHGIDEKECKRIVEAGGSVACTVRNPWDLMVSWYHYCLGNGSTTDYFNTWAMNVLETGNGWLEKGFYGVEHCNRIFYFEHDLERQLNNCLQDCRLPAVKLPRLGATQHHHYSMYYNKEAAAMVGVYFASDIKEWGYRFQSK